MGQLPQDKEKKKLFLPSSKTKLQTDENGNYVLDKSGEPVKIAVPEEEWDWVVLEIGPVVAGDSFGMDPRAATDPAASSVAVLANRIKEWSYTKHDGAREPINFDNVAKLDAEDYQYLILEVGGKKNVKPITDEERLKLSATSSPTAINVRAEA